MGTAPCSTHSSPLQQTAGLCYKMASSSECSQIWERTSSPVIVNDKRKDLWRIRLMYTRPRQKPQRVQSTTFKTLEDAEAAQHPWRLSWEKGRRGKPVTSANLPAGDTLSGSGPEAAVSAMLPKGKSLNSMGILNGAQNQAYKKSRREGYIITKAQWMQSQTLTDREKRCITKDSQEPAVKSMCPKSILTVERVRHFARRTRDFCRSYLALEKDGLIESKEQIEKMRKVSKAHRNIIDMEPAFIDKQ